MKTGRITRHLPGYCAAVALVVLAGQLAALAGPAGMTSAPDRAGRNAPRFSPARPANVEEFATVPELRSIYFEYDQSQVRPEAAAIVDRDAEWLKANPFYEVLISAHADGRGTARYNLALADRRAQALRDELVSRGVRADRIVTASYGLGLPACGDEDEECWSQNRRADILVRWRPAQTP